MNNYISVSQYAEIKGISKQAVYKQLNGKLKEFLIVVDNQKFIDLNALNEVEKERLNNIEQPVEQQFNNSFQLFFENPLRLLAKSDTFRVVNRRVCPREGRNLPSFTGKTKEKQT